MISLIWALPLVYAWNYSQGGTDWEGLCMSGREQSPINIDTDDTSKLGDTYKIEIFYYGKTQSRTLVNNGNYIFMEGDFGYITVVDEDDEERKFLTHKVEFHYPSEHHFDGYESFMEMQIFHIIDDSDYTVDFPSQAVLSVMIRPGDPSYFFDSIEVWNIPKANSEYSLPDDSNINLLSIVEPNDHYFFYHGSENTPECEGNVLWYVFETEQWVSFDQMSYFKALWVDDLNFSGGTGNVRVLQALNGREVFYSSALIPSILLFYLLA